MIDDNYKRNDHIDNNKLLKEFRITQVHNLTRLEKNNNDQKKGVIPLQRLFVLRFYLHCLGYDVFIKRDETVTKKYSHEPSTKLDEVTTTTKKLFFFCKQTIFITQVQPNSDDHLSQIERNL